MKGFIGGIVFTLVVGIVAGLLVAYDGWAPVAATTKAPGAMEWLLETTRDSAVEDGAEEVREKGDVPDLDQKRLLDRGLEHYNEMCVACHGAPGVQPVEYAPDLNPVPPDLAKSDLSPEAMYWVVKHGIQMTGMPAFGPTHSEEDLWALVAFVRRLPAMTAGDYAKRVRAAGLKLPEREESKDEAGADAPAKGGD